MNNTAIKTVVTSFQPLTYTIPHCCTLGNFSRAWLYLQWAKGEGPKRFKLGSKTLVMAEDFHAWINHMAGN